MRTVWKYPIDLGLHQVLTPPSPARPLMVAEQDGRLCLWVLVDPAADLVARVVHVVGTGHPVPDGVEYVGSVQSGPFVWHCWVEAPGADS